MPEMDGLYPKFVVRRTDPEAEARHQGCALFVLDVTHDPHARAAVLAYAESCQGTKPGLASDLRQLVMRAPK